MGRKRYRDKERDSLYAMLLAFAQKRMRLILFSISFFCASGGIFYFLFASSYFQIKEVRIEGLATLPREQILSKAEDAFRQKKFLFLSAKNYFLFPVKNSEASLVQNFPKILKIKIQKIYPANVAIQIDERKALGIWCAPGEQKQCFYFDKEGVIFEQAPASFGSLIPVILDERPVEPRLGAAILAKKEAQTFEDIYGIVSRNFLFSIRALRVTEKGEFEILTSEDWKIFLDKEASVNDQFSNLKYLLEEKIKNRRHELEYVDLRLGSKVYYKYAESID